jgi:single-strand DNA-binding protein
MRLALAKRHGRTPSLRYREVEDEVKGTTFKHRIAEIHAISMKRLSKVEAADDPADGADDESSPARGGRVE